MKCKVCGKEGAHPIVPYLFSKDIGLKEQLDVMENEEGEGWKELQSLDEGEFGPVMTDDFFGPFCNWCVLLLELEMPHMIDEWIVKKKSGMEKRMCGCPSGSSAKTATGM